MAEYAAVRRGKLKLKGNSGSLLGHKKKRTKRKKDDTEEEWMKEPGAVRHGNWRKIRSVEEMKDRVVLEMHTGGYLKAEDTGSFSVGEVRSNDDEPDPTEIFTVVTLSDTKIAIKSGYGRYLGVDTAGEVVGKAEAMGPREQWEPVFEEGKMAICGCNHRFLGLTSDKVMAISEKAREKEMIMLRTDVPMGKKSKTDAEIESDLAAKNLSGFETDFVKKYQSFQDHKLRVNTGSRDGLDRARQEGKLHEALLDRREKMKADRYCK